MNKTHTYYKVIFDDGDIEIELFPDEEDFEDYDPTDLKLVKIYANQFKGARILKITEKYIS